MVAGAPVGRCARIKTPDSGRGILRSRRSAPVRGGFAHTHTHTHALCQNVRTTAGHGLARGRHLFRADAPCLASARSSPCGMLRGSANFRALLAGGLFKIERRVMSEAMDIMLKIGITETVSAGKLSNGDLRQRR